MLVNKVQSPIRGVVGLVLVSLALCSGCTRDADSAATPIRTPADMPGHSCAVVVGTSLQNATASICDGIRFVSFNDFSSALEALRVGRVDTMPIDTPMARQWVAARSDELAIAFEFPGNPNGYFFAKGSPLRERVNSILVDMKRRGEIDRIFTKWCNAKDIAQVPEENWPKPAGYTGKKGKLRLAIACDAVPGSFIRNDKLVGFDVDILRYIVYTLDMECTPMLMNNRSAVVPAVQSGKADMGGGCVTITAERAAKVDFTDAYVDTCFSMIVRKEKPRAACPTIRTAADLKGAHVAHMSSDFHRQELVHLQPEVKFDPYTEYAFAFESLRRRKIEAISLSDIIASIWCAKFPGEFTVAFSYAADHCALLFPKGCRFAAAINAELRKMSASGELAKIMSKWTDAAKRNAVPELPVYTPAPSAPVLRVAAAAQVEPWCFVSNERPVGSDIELLILLAQRLGLRLEIKPYSWGGMVDAVNANRADVGCGGAYVGGGVFPTLDISEFTDNVKMCVLVRNENAQKKDTHLGLGAFIRDLKDSFMRTFVVEARWKMMARGLGVTIFITLCASILGTLLAFPVWFLRTARNRFVSACARAYISILQGTPVLVLLMVLFYLVFGHVDIDGIWVAILGFALNASAYVGEMLRSGIESVPRGQTEAALALGYRPQQAFLRFVLPQAIRAIMPVYRGELIGLLKATSIVGYIAINDLNKASDLIRSRTYESFFPILTTAFIYFVAAWLLAKILDAFGRHLDPATRRTQK